MVLGADPTQGAATAKLSFRRKSDRGIVAEALTADGWAPRSNSPVRNGWMTDGG